MTYIRVKYQLCFLKVLSQVCDWRTVVVTDF